MNEWGPLVFRLAVKKAHQRKGLGSTLLTEVEEYLRKQYHAEVHLLVNEDERQTRKWFEKRGYKAEKLYRWYSKKI
jgi:ribosomal protein S18 acetylase RimI-like enzyme